MLDYRNALEIKYSDDGSFTDYKAEGLDFTRDDFTIEMVADEDYIYIGYYKPINSIYVAMTTANENSGDLTVSYYNGTEFTAISEQFDQTECFTRDGFITWERNIEDEDETTIDSLEKYWYRISISADSSEIVFRAINILFSDDQALKVKFNKVLDSKYLDGETTYNKLHQAARDEITEAMKRSYVKIDNSSTTKVMESISPWDFLDIYEVKEAATYLVLSMIFFGFSDDPDDIYMEKSKKFEGKYQHMLNASRLSIDENDDGKSTDDNLDTKRNKFMSR